MRTLFSIVMGLLTGCQCVAGIDDRALNETSSSTGAGNGGFGAGGADACPSTRDCDGDGICECEGWCEGDACTLPPEGAFLWLRSDADLSADAAGLSWKDQISGELATSTEEESIPSIVTSDEFGGHKVVRFDGVNDRIALPAVDSSFSEGLTAALVLREVAAATKLDNLLFFGRQNGPDSFGHAIALERDDVNDLRFTVQANYYPWTWNDGIVQSSRPLAPLPPRAQMLIVTQRADDASVWFHLDGSSLPKWFGDAGIPEPSLRDACFLGGSSAVESGTFDGDIAEVLLYDRSLSDEERTELQHYFATKYGIEIAPPCTTCPEVLASGQGRPLYVAAYGNRVAWTNSEGGQVMSIEDATVPSAPEAVYAPGPTYARPTGVAMDATGIYWGEGQDGLHSPPFAVHRVRWSDRDHASASANGEVLGVAVADGTLYAALYSYGLTWVVEPTWIATTVPASKRLTYVAADDTHLYFSYFNATPGEDGVYRALMANLGGGSLDTDAESVANVLGPSQIVLDATHAYVVDVTLALFRVHKLSKVSELVVNDDVRWIALAPPHVFYTTADAVKRVAMTGGTPIPIAEDQPEPMGIVVVDEWLVWANSDGTIVRLPKPM